MLWRVDETALLEPALRLERCVGGARKFYLVEATNAASASTCHLEGSAAVSSADRRAVGGWWHGAFGA